MSLENVTKMDSSVNEKFCLDELDDIVAYLLGNDYVATTLAKKLKASLNISPQQQQFTHPLNALNKILHYLLKQKHTSRKFPEYSSVCTLVNNLLSIFFAAHIIENGNYSYYEYVHEFKELIILIVDLKTFIYNLYSENLNINSKVIISITELLFDKTRFELNDTSSHDSFYTAIETFLLNFYPKIPIETRLSILEIILHSLNTGELFLVSRRNRTLISCILKTIVPHATEYAEFEFLEKIIVGFSFYNITTPDLKKILLAMKPTYSEFQNTPNCFNPVEDLLKNFEYLISHKSNTIEFTSSVSTGYVSSNSKKSKICLPRCFDVLLNVLHHASNFYRTDNLCSFYINGYNSQNVIRFVPNTMSNENHSFSSWTISFWIYPMISKKHEDTVEVEILHLETYPSIFNLTLSIKNDVLIIVYQGQIYTISVGGMPLNKWMMISIVCYTVLKPPRKETSSELLNTHFLKFYLNDSLCLSLQKLSEYVVFVRSFHICCSPPISSNTESEVKLSTKNALKTSFMGFLNSCMFIADLLEPMQVVELYIMGPYHFQLINFPLHSKFTRYLHYLLKNNKAVLQHPNCFHVKTNHFSIFTNLIVNSYSNSNILTHVGVISEICNVFIFRQSSFNNALNSLGGVKVILTFMEGLNDTESLVGSKTSDSFEIDSSVNLVEKELVKNAQKKAIVKKRTSLIMKIINNLINNPIVSTNFFESTCLDIIALIVSTGGNGYINPSFLSQCIQLANTCRLNPIIQKYKEQVEKCIIFNHYIWSQISTMEDSKEWFICVDDYVTEELDLSFKNKSLSSNNSSSDFPCEQRVTYLTYHIYYILKAIFFCPEYLVNMSEKQNMNSPELAKNNLIPLNEIFKYQQFLNDVLPILRNIIAKCEKKDVSSVGSLLHCLLVPEPGIVEVNERVVLLLKSLLLNISHYVSIDATKYSTKLYQTVDLVDKLFSATDVYLLFQIVRACPESVNTVLQIVRLICSIEKSYLPPSLETAVYIYTWKGAEVNHNKANYMYANQYALIHPIDSIDINESTANTLFELAFGISIDQILDSYYNHIEAFKFNTSYINLFLYAIVMNKSPDNLLNTLVSATVQSNMFSNHLIDVLDEYLIAACHLLSVKNGLSVFHITGNISTVSGLAKVWISKYIYNKMKFDNFSNSLLTVFCYIYCIFSKVNALVTFVDVINLVMDEVKNEIDNPSVPNEVFAIISSLINHIIPFKHNTTYFFTKFLNSLDLKGISLINAFPFSVKKYDFRLIRENEHISMMSEKHIPGIKEIFLGRSDNMLNESSVYHFSCKISCTTVYTKMIEVLIYRLKNLKSSNNQFNDENLFISNLKSLINVFINVPPHMTSELASEIGTSIEELNSIIDGKNISEPNVLYAYELLIGLIDKLYTIIIVQYSKHVIDSETPLMKIILVYIGTLISFKKYTKNDYYTLPDVNLNTIEELFSKTPDELMCILNSSSWRAFINDKINHSNKRLYKEKQAITVKIANDLSNRFYTAAHELYREFIHVCYYPKLHMEEIDKILCILFKYRAEILLTSVCTDVRKYQDSKIERFMLYKKIFCESGLFSSSTVRWAVDSREMGEKMRGRLMPNWIINCESENEGETRMEEYNKLISNIPLKTLNSGNIIPSLVKKPNLFFISKNLYRIVDFLPENTPELLKGGIELGISSIEKIGKDIFVPFTSFLGLVTEKILQIEKNNDFKTELYKTSCEYIFTFYSAKGTLYVTKEELIFTQDTYSGVTGITDNLDSVIMTQLLFSTENFFKKKVWRISDIEFCFMRRHLLCHTALEFFFKDKTSCLLNFPDNSKSSDSRKMLIETIKTVRPDMRDKIILFNTKEFSFLLKELSKLWVTGKKSNFEYLTLLNLMSGRTYNDFSQYPVFPWILTDYESEKIDLKDEKIYRDLSKPVGALNEERISMFKSRYESMKESGDVENPFFYGTHYSSSSSVVFYMMRLEPFASIHCSINGGKFDIPSRLFRDIKKCWKSVLESSYDVKELIPEFFYMPEMFININKYHFGKSQDGEVIGDVVLPNWAKSPYDFVRIHREALESDYVSSNLHKWIDLIWGYKQMGKEAEEAFNVFHHLTYEDSTDINSIENETEKKNILSHIAYFGQTPLKLFDSPHTPKKTFKHQIIAQCEEENLKRALPVEVWTIYCTTSKILLAFNVSKSLKWVFSSLEKPNIGIFPRAHIDLNNKTFNKVKLNEVLLKDTHLIAMVRENYELEYVLYVKSKRNESYTLKPIYSTNLRSLCYLLNIVWANYSDYKFSVSPDGTILGVYNSSINSFAIIDLVSGHFEESTCYGHQNGAITNLAFSKTGKKVYIGSSECRVISWQINNSAETNKKELKVENEYIGHMSSIEHICCNVDNDVIYSSSKNLRIIAHSCSNAKYMYSRFPIKKNEYKECSIRSMFSSKNANLIVHIVYFDLKVEETSFTKVLDNFCNKEQYPVHEISMYNINGLLIASRTIESHIHSVKLFYNIISDQILLTVNNKLHVLSNTTLEDINVIEVSPDNIENICESFDKKTIILLGKHKPISIYTI